VCWKNIDDWGDHTRFSKFLDEERDIFEKTNTWIAGGAPGARHRIGTKSKGAVVTGGGDIQGQKCG